MKPFLKRTSREGMKESPFYNDVKINPYADGTGPTGTGLPNCVCYCLGRACELAGKSVRDDIMGPRYPDAKRWWEVTKWPKVTTDFKVGDTLVWGGTYGHVATVEFVRYNGNLIISQSNFDRTPATMDKNYYQLWEIERPVAGRITPKIELVFLGAIRNPHVIDIHAQRDPNKFQVEVRANAMRCRDNNLNIRTGLYIHEGLYNILETKQKDGYTWAKVAENVWFALNDDAGWTKTYRVTQTEPLKVEEKPKEEPKSAENETAPEQPESSLSEQLQKAVEELQKVISDLQSENRKMIEEKEKVLAAAEEKKAALVKAEEEVKRYQDILEKMKELIA